MTFLRAIVSVWIMGATLLCPRDSEAISIGFDPVSAAVSLGDTLDVGILISDLGGEIVSAYDLDVSYDATILSATGVSFGSFLNDGDPFNSFQVFDLSTPGLIDLAELSLLFDSDLLSSQPDSFLLATISFSTLAEGTSALTLVPDPVFGVDVTGLDAQILQLNVDSGNVTVSARASVPEPSTWVLLGVGVAFMALFMGFHRRTFELRR